MVILRGRALGGDYPQRAGQERTKGPRAQVSLPCGYGADERVSRPSKARIVLALCRPSALARPATRSLSPVFR